MRYALQIFSLEDQHRFVEFKGMCVWKSKGANMNYIYKPLN